MTTPRRVLSDARPALAATGVRPTARAGAAARGAMLALPATLAMLAAAAAPAAAAEPAPAGVVSLTAAASVQVPRDWMSVTFSITRDGSDASEVQAQIAQALEAALAQARRVARPGAVEVSAGDFSLQPRNDRAGRIDGWVGTTSMTAQGRDLVALAKLAGQVRAMTVQAVDYGLAPETRQKAEVQASSQAIARYRARAADVARDFGYAHYEIREVNVQSDMPQGPRPYLMRSAMAAAPAAAPLPVEGGDERVTVSVSGTVQLSH